VNAVLFDVPSKLISSHGFSLFSANVSTFTNPKTLTQSGGRDAAVCRIVAQIHSSEIHLATKGSLPARFSMYCYSEITDS
jgi:hypothetical protein